MERSDKLIKLKEHFGNICSACGEGRLWLLEFHHVEPRYISGRPAWTKVRSWSYERILEEYERECELLCKNCHGDTHHKNPFTHTTRNQPSPS